MALQQDLFEIERGFWLDGEDFFLAHVDTECMLVFTQMKGVYSRAEVAASARDPNRWKELRLADQMLVEPSDGVAAISYEARVKRGTGEPYRALVSSAYVRRDDGWKLFFHQHSSLEAERTS